VEPFGAAAIGVVLHEMGDNGTEIVGGDVGNRSVTSDGKDEAFEFAPLFFAAVLPAAAIELHVNFKAGADGVGGFDPGFDLRLTCRPHLGDDWHVLVAGDGLGIGPGPGIGEQVRRIGAELDGLDFALGPARHRKLVRPVLAIWTVRFCDTRLDIVRTSARLWRALARSQVSVKTILGMVVALCQKAVIWGQIYT
jgi:hypothetical protein